MTRQQITRSAWPAAAPGWSSPIVLPSESNTYAAADKLMNAWPGHYARR